MVNPAAPALGFNVFVKENTTIEGGQITGSIATGSNFNLNGSATLVENSNGTHPTGILDNENNYGLVIGGSLSLNLSGTIYINKGLIKLGNTTGISIWDKDNNNSQIDLRLTKAGTAFDGNPRIESRRKVAASTVTEPHGINFNAAFRQLEDLSYGLSEFNTKTSVAQFINKFTVPTDQNQKIRLEENKVNYLNLTISQLATLNKIPFENKPSATRPVVINIIAPGAHKLITPSMEGLGDNDANYIIWNFAGATELEIITGQQFFGTILAPEAHIIKNNDPNIHGQIIGKNFTLKKGTITYRPFGALLIDPLGFEEGSLPLRGMELQAQTQHEKIALSWTVYGEEDMAGYMLEKSNDGRNFSELAYMMSAGNNEVFTYKYNDRATTPDAVVYYRVKAIEENTGKLYYSNVVALKPAGAANAKVQLWPNPVVSQLTVNYNATTSGTVNALLLNMEGKAIKQHRYGADKGINRFVLSNLQSLPSGTYFLKLIDEQTGAATVHKVIK